MESFPAAPLGDGKAGEQVFKTKCIFCHTVEKGGGHKNGPNMNGLFERPAGTAPGYSYSEANKNVAIIWDDGKLYEYLLNPKQYIPGTKKNFHGLKNPQQRADVIAYLKDATS